MVNSLEEQIRASVAGPGRDVFQTKDVFVGEIAYEAEEERYLADVAVRDVGEWRVAEVWVEAGEVSLINDLGEGFPLEDVPWPWPNEAG